MNPADNIANAVGREAARELESALQKIDHCLAQLTTEQVWSRQSESMNSIANLLLHLSGNLRQWIISGVGGAPDERERQQEFDQRTHIEKKELFSALSRTTLEAKDVLVNVSPEELLRVRRVQGFEVSAMEAIFHSVSHFRGHVQEIVYMTRCLLKDQYQFDFVPNEEQA